MTELGKLIERLETTTGADRASLKDAVVAASLFAQMRVDGESSLTFQMVEGRPTDRCLAALSTLVESEIISVRAFNQYGGLVYRPLVDCHPAFIWMYKHSKDPEVSWPISQNMTSRKEAKTAQAFALRARHPSG